MVFLVFQSDLDLNFDSMAYGLLRLHAKDLMNHGKLVFSELTAYLPLRTFRRCVATHRGDHKVQEFTCIE